MNQTVKDIVVADFRAASVFERYGIDFCCGGGVPLDDACRQKGLDPTAVRGELSALDASGAPASERFEAWELDRLADHIVDTHHRTVRQTLPSLLAHTDKVARVHGERHPETIEIARLAQAVADELTSHMQKEEMMLFPAIRAMARARREGRPMPQLPFGSVAFPIGVMESEHASAGDALGRMRRLSSGYRPPEDACTTYRVAYQELEAFEADLHVHIHKENNILFPAAIALEQSAA